MTKTLISYSIVNMFNFSHFSNKYYNGYEQAPLLLRPNLLHQNHQITAIMNNNL